jgi:hypothetical protein
MEFEGAKLGIDIAKHKAQSAQQRFQPKKEKT